MKYYLILLIFLISNVSNAQITQTVDTTELVSATEFSIPQSGAFTLLGNTATEVNTPGFTKDLKFDAFLNKFSLKPNIAFEIQPVWLFGYKNTTLQQYQTKTAVARFLSTASVSLGTTQANDSVNKFAYSIKFSFFHDPMNDKNYIQGIDNILATNLAETEQKQIDLSVKKFGAEKQREKLILQKQSETDPAKLAQIEKDIDSLNIIITKVIQQLTETDVSNNTTLKNALNKYIKEYIESKWILPKMDIGFGKVYTYTDPDVTKIKLNQQGFGFWANPSIGFIPAKWFNKNIDSKKSDKLLLTGIYKNVQTDSIRQEFYGGNIKYGSAFLNFFVEYVYSDEGKGKTERKQTVAYGGSYTIGTKKLIQFGLRTDYDNHFKFLKIKPVISFNWELGKELIK